VAAPLEPEQIGLRLLRYDGHQRAGLEQRLGALDRFGAVADH
jgi:hypothetical protein